MEKDSSNRKSKISCIYCGKIGVCYILAEKKPVHYLINEKKTYENYNEQISFFVILLTHVFVTTSHKY